MRQAKLLSGKDTIYVELWYDENRNKVNMYEDRDWFLREIYFPSIEPLLKTLGKKVVLTTHSFKDKKDTKMTDISAVKEFSNFRAPDLLLVINGEPILVLETTDAVPTGNQPGKKVPILLKSSELRIPSLLYLPLLRVRPPPHHSNAFCDLRVCKFVLSRSKETGVPTHVFFSERYTDLPLKTRYIEDRKIILSFLKSDEYLREYVKERIVLFFEGNLLKNTEKDLELLDIVERYYKWSEGRLKGRIIVVGNRIIFRQDPDRGWSERGTGCLEAVESQVIELKDEIKKSVEVWFPNLGKKFWWFRERQSIRLDVLKQFADVIKFQDDLSKKDFESIKDMLEKHHSGKRRRETLFLSNNSSPRLRNSVVVFSNPEDWLNGIPELLKRLPHGSKIILPRLTRNFWFFKNKEWSTFVGSFNEALYQDDLTQSEFRVLEEHFKE